MGTYRKEWPCCGDVTETDAWEPEDCPFCRSSSSVSEGEMPEPLKYGGGMVNDYVSGYNAALSHCRAATKAAAPADALSGFAGMLTASQKPLDSDIATILHKNIDKLYSDERAPAEDAREEVQVEAWEALEQAAYALKEATGLHSLGFNECLANTLPVGQADETGYTAGQYATAAEEIRASIRNARDMVRAALARRASSVPAIPGTPWISVEDELPEEGERVLVTRYAGRVGNPGHPGHPGVPWVEVTRYMVNCSMFECDLLSTGNVTHWTRIAAAPSHPSEAKAGEPNHE